MSADTDFVYLRISSFQGVSPGAEHYYGKLIGYKPEYCHIELEKVLTDEEAARLSKKDDWKYRAGSTTGRFESKEEIIKIALSSYKTHFPMAKVLILGNPANCEPQKILDAPKKIKKAGNILFDEVEKMEWLGRGMYYRSKKDEKRVDELTDKWDALMETL